MLSTSGLHGPGWRPREEARGGPPLRGQPRGSGGPEVAGLESIAWCRLQGLLQADQLGRCDPVLSSRRRQPLAEGLGRALRTRPCQSVLDTAQLCHPRHVVEATVLGGGWRGRAGDTGCSRGPRVPGLPPRGTDPNCWFQGLS